MEVSYYNCRSKTRLLAEHLPSTDEIKLVIVLIFEANEAFEEDLVLLLPHIIEEDIQ